MGRKAKYRKFTEAYRELAVRRLKEAENVSDLCRELGISRQILYQWRERFERREQQLDPAQSSERQLRQEVAQLKTALAEKTLALDFLKGALQKVEALRQGNTVSGATASTSKSGK
jgi:transposase-like protein